MPIFSVTTNQIVEDERRKQLLHDATQAMADMLGKSKGAVMVEINTGVSLMLGDSDDPVAHVKLKLFAFDKTKASEYVKTITQWVTSRLGVPADRQFQQLIDMPPEMFGYNGDTC